MPRGKLEEEWSDANEEFVRSLSHMCSTKSEQHQRAGYSFKSKNNNWGLPMVLIPVIMSPVSLIIQDDDVSMYVNAFAFLATGVVNGVYSFFKYGEKTVDHFNYSGRYADIVSDIELELQRGREFRVSLDVFLAKIHMRMDNLASTEPVLPKHIATAEYNAAEMV